jgi:hypothetical protein
MENGRSVDFFEESRFDWRNGPMQEHEIGAGHPGEWPPHSVSVVGSAGFGAGYDHHADEALG